jgi:hypothetical protein
MVVKQLQNDIGYSTGAIRMNMEKLADGAGKTLQGMVEWGMKNVDRKTLLKDDKSTVRGVLWTNRATMFITQFVLALSEGREGSASSKRAYKESVAPYHGWLTSKAVGTAMSFAPSRKDIFKKMGLPSEEEAKKQSEAFLALMKPLNEEIVAFLTAMEANFPEKV